VKDVASQEDLYRRIGMNERIGYGERPAVLVIDMCRGITERGHTLSIDMDHALAPLNEILDVARRRNVPVIYTTVAYTPPHLADGGTFVRKIPLLREFVEGSPLTEIDPRCAPARGDILLTKKFPSGFYGTNLQSILTSLGVDTTIVTGNSTSGCVRATVCDAVSGGFRVIVPRECVADRAPLSHSVNLFDMDSKYADVVAAADVVKYLSEISSGPLGVAMGVAGVK